jgi:hypothetical protein
MYPTTNYIPRHHQFVTSTTKTNSKSTNATTTTATETGTTMMTSLNHPWIHPSVSHDSQHVKDTTEDDFVKIGEQDRIVICF